ncbi:hypothetical protein [Burkholderia plantarii]|uniref:hypothetical protein n=1 Tax=Burkholderia plantarii TaxID=41899 RepID=UPI0005AF269E|nr:hypothetical protein [Burkholderia plantarii]
MKTLRLALLSVIATGSVLAAQGAFAGVVAVGIGVPAAPFVVAPAVPVYPVPVAVAAPVVAAPVVVAPGPAVVVRTGYVYRPTVRAAVIVR